MHSEGIKVLNYIGHKPSFRNLDKSNQRQTCQPHQIVHATTVFPIFSTLLELIIFMLTTYQWIRPAENIFQYFLHKILICENAF